MNALIYKTIVIFSVILIFIFWGLMNAYPGVN